MSTDTHSVESLATEAEAWFETATRPDGDTYDRLRDGAPEWVTDLVREAHGDMLPDDWRYSCIRAAVSHIADDGDPDDAHDFADSYADVYTGRLLAWLASHLSRVAYCDDAVTELGYDPDRGITGMIGLGQYAEASEVYGLVARALAERLEAIEDEEAGA